MGKFERGEAEKLERDVAVMWILLLRTHKEMEALLLAPLG